MFTKDSRILNRRLTVPLTSVSKAIGDVFKPYVSLFDRIIQDLFANNEQGFAYDPNDLTTMFQDAAGTVPVTGAGQPVGLIRDKSGRGNHAMQTVSASRPILQRNATTGAYYLAFDGADDFLVTNNIDFTSTDKVSVFAGVRKLSDGVNAIVELSNSIESIGNTGVFLLAVRSTSYAYFSKGTIPQYGAVAQLTSLPAPNSAVLVAKSSISTDLTYIRANNSVSAMTGGDQGTGNYGNYPLYIGRRGGSQLPFNGQIYSLIGIGRLTTNAETAALEKLIAKNTGVTLSV